MRLDIFLKNKVAKNAGWIIIGRIYQMLLAFLVGLLTARYLGPGNYGLINYATTYTSFFSAICTLGINSVIIKNFVDHPDEVGETIGTSIFVRTITSFLSIVTIICISLFADAGEPLTIIVVALTSIGVIFQVFDTLNYWFQSKLQSKYSTFATVIAYTVVTVYKVWLLVTSKSVQWFAVSTALDYCVVALFLMCMYRKNNGPRWKVSFGKAKELLTASCHFILAGLMVSIYASTDKFMLKQMLGESQVGYYSTSVQICNTWVFILSAIIDSMYPSILETFGKNDVLFKKRNRQLYAIVFYMSIAVSSFISIFANVIVKILYGEAYLDSALSLRIITWYTAFSYLGVARNAWMVCYKCQKYLPYLYIGSAIANVALNYILIPHLGAQGAAIASLATQISTILLFPMFIKALRPNVKLMVEAITLKKYDKEM